MEYYSAIKRNETELFVVRWMDLKTVIQSEVSQKEKNKYRKLIHIYIESKRKKEGKKMVRRTYGQDGNKDADLLENGFEEMGRGKGKLGQRETVAWTDIHYQT